MNSQPSSAPFAPQIESTVTKALYVTHPVARGIAVAVVRDGTIVYERGFGVSGPAGKPVTPATRFAIGSLTKQFTAAAVLMLAQDGKLTLDDPLSTYVPLLPNANTITVRDLLHQTSGLHTYPFLGEHDWPTKGPITPATLFAFMAKDPSDFPPGTKYAYSNANYAALAEVVSSVNRMPYGDYLNRDIIRPLHLSQTGYGFKAQLPADAAPTGDDGCTWIKESDRISLDLYYGAGGLVSSAHDLALWNAALLGDRFAGASMKSLLWTPGRLRSGAPVDYAMGFVPARFDQRREVWHNGYAPRAGGYTYSALLPDDHVAVVVLTNSGNAEIESFSRAIVREVFESYYPPEAGPDDPAVTARIRALLVQLRGLHVDREHLTPEFSAFLNPMRLALVWPYFKTLGDPVSLVLQESSTTGTARAYRYRGEFSDGTVHDVNISFAGDAISGFQVPP